MLYFPQTRPELTVERPLQAGVTVNAEGCALVGNIVGGVYGLKPSAGGETSLAGVAINTPIQPLSLPFIETLVVSAAGQVVLSNTPVGGSIYVINATTGSALTPVASAPTASQYMLDGTNVNALDTNTSNSGVSLTVAYRYSPTVQQAMQLQGNVLPGGPAGAYLGQVGVITRGDIYTSEFDTSVSWTSAVGVTLEANGLFGPANTAGAAVSGVQIISLPSTGSAYLGLFVNVPN
jgi:hypothetical protein